MERGAILFSHDRHLREPKICCAIKTCQNEGTTPEKPALYEMKSCLFAFSQMAPSLQLYMLYRQPRHQKGSNNKDFLC